MHKKQRIIIMFLNNMGIMRKILKRNQNIFIKLYSTEKKEE